MENIKRIIKEVENEIDLENNSFYNELRDVGLVHALSYQYGAVTCAMAMKILSLTKKLENEKAKKTNNT